MLATVRLSSQPSKGAAVGTSDRACLITTVETFARRGLACHLRGAFPLSTAIHRLATFSGTVAIEWLRIGDMAVPVREYRALNTRRPFSRADARRAGIGLRELLSPRFHKIFYDCYVASTVPITTELRAGSGTRHLATRLLCESLHGGTDLGSGGAPRLRCSSDRARSGRAHRTTWSQGPCGRWRYCHDPHQWASDHDARADVP